MYISTDCIKKPFTVRKKVTRNTLEFIFIFVMGMDIFLNESREICHFTVWKAHLLPSPCATCADHAW